MRLTYLVPQAGWNGGACSTSAATTPQGLPREMHRLFERVFAPDAVAPGAPFAATGPRLDLSETAELVRVTLELPGVAQSDLDVELTANSLIVRGEKRDTRPTEGEKFHRTERTFGRFERTISLPLEIQREGVTATYQNGVLEIVIPKLNKTPETRKVEVRTEV